LLEELLRVIGEKRSSVGIHWERSLEDSRREQGAEIKLQSCEVKEGSKLCNLEVFFQIKLGLGFKALHIFFHTFWKRRMWP